MCQSRFARVIIILATILCRLHSLPLDIFQLSQEVKDGGAATARDHEEDFLIWAEQRGGCVKKKKSSSLYSSLFYQIQLRSVTHYLCTQYRD